MQAEGLLQPTTTWHSNSLKLDFAYPLSFKGEGPDKSADKPNKDCVTNPIATMDMRTGFNMIFVRRYDTACLAKKLKGLDPPSQEVVVANAMTSDILNNLGPSQITSHASYELSTHPAYLITGSVTVPHSTGKNTIFSATACVISGQYIGCFEFVSNDCANLANLAASTITFEGASPVPAIPPETTLGCKP